MYFSYFLVKQVTSGHLSAELQSSAICNSNAACSYSARVSNRTISRAKWTTFNVVTGRISPLSRDYPGELVPEETSTHTTKKLMNEINVTQNKTKKRLLRYL